MLDDHGQLIRAREKALKAESGGDAETVVYFGGYHREESYYLQATVPRPSALSPVAPSRSSAFQPA